MFNSIARNYDFLNHFLSFGIDVFWRKRLIRELKKYKPVRILDVATGTADLSIMASKIKGTELVGVLPWDFGIATSSVRFGFRSENFRYNQESD